MHILNGKLIRADMNSKARGGTELLCERLVGAIDPELLSKFQIVVSRLEFPLEEDKIRIYYLHDLPGDPASEHLKNGGWEKFDWLVFVSNWQMQAYINHYQIPYSKCVVVRNSVIPIPEHEKPKDVIRFAYWSTPHRGLNILVPAFEELCKRTDKNIELDVYSSFKLYGWEERDQQFEELFERCRQHPKINYHGTVSNEELRKGLEQCHILAYPNTWVETSCLTLMEAMSARMLCIHPNLGALYETAAGLTRMYQFNENVQDHLSDMIYLMQTWLDLYDHEYLQHTLDVQKYHADTHYNWNLRADSWEKILAAWAMRPTTALPKPMFTYTA